MWVISRRQEAGRGQCFHFFVTAAVASKAGDKALKIMPSECPKG